MTEVRPEWLRALLVCPRCRGELRDAPAGLVCDACRLAYPVERGTPFLVAECARPLEATEPASGAAR